MSRAVVLLSGGLDSAVTLAIASRECDEIYALTVGYGQRHYLEVACARKIANKAKVREHRVLDVDLASWGGSSLTGDGDVPKDRDLPEAHDAVPPTYVPGRNTVLLSLALAWAEVIEAEAIYIGVHMQDAGGYPDTRSEYLRAFEDVVRLGTQAGLVGRGPEIRAPLIEMSKSEIVSLGSSLGVDFADTLSCYDPRPSGEPCGRCDACRLRAKGFDQAGEQDPGRGSDR